MALVIKRKNLGFWRSLYLIDVVKGMMITGGHFIRNVLNPSRMGTFSWPEIKKTIETTYRAEHRLMLRDDESIRCTACMLCATVCPAHCIHIDAAEGDIPEKEKYPTAFTIDLLRCIYCGYCVEACPCDAIRMDTQKLTEANYSRLDFIKDIEYLRANHGSKDPHSEGQY
jgi:NADH-quinone oxidoreductase subunit I